MVGAKLITIVIVNWNAGSLLRECVASIVTHHHELVDTVIVVDNGSSDDSMTALSMPEGLPFSLEIVRNDRNAGFAAACNQGAGLASTEYLLFLNPDTRLFTNSLLLPVATMEAPENVDVGVVGIQLLDESGEVARSCGRFPTLAMFIAHTFAINRLRPYRHANMHMEEWDHRATRDVDHVIGAFFLIRQALFKHLSGFDERFFVYLEDLDLSLRVHRHGYRSMYLSDAQAFHVGGGTSRQVKAHRLFYSLRSRLLYGFKHFSTHQAWALLLTIVFLEPFTRSFFAILRRSALDLSATLRAYGMLYRDLPRILRIRQES